MKSTSWYQQPVWTLSSEQQCFIQNPLLAEDVLKMIFCLCIVSTVPAYVLTPPYCQLYSRNAFWAVQAITSNTHMLDVIPTRFVFRIKSSSTLAFLFFNSLALERFEVCNLMLILVIDGWVFCEIALRRLSLDITHDKSTLIRWWLGAIRQ